METIEVSDETYAKIKDQIEADKKKEFEPKFEPIEVHDGCFVVSVSRLGNYVEIKTGDDYNGIDCKQYPHQIDKFIQALQKAKAFIEANK